MPTRHPLQKSVELEKEICCQSKRHVWVGQILFIYYVGPWDSVTKTMCGLDDEEKENIDIQDQKHMNKRILGLLLTVKYYLLQCVSLQW